LSAKETTAEGRVRFGTTEPITLADMQVYLDQSRYTNMIGAYVTKCADGEAELRLPFKDDLTQHHGFIHGSLFGFLADAACAWAASSVAGDVRTSEYKINLLAPGAGDEFIGRGKVIKVTRRTVVAQGEVFALQDGEEKLIAIAMATLMRVSDPLVE
jgi:uncharacterized protein (TIGR00369 family)